MLELCRCPNIYGPDCVCVYIYIYIYIYILYIYIYFFFLNQTDFFFIVIIFHFIRFFFCIFDQIIVALVSLRNFVQRQKKILLTLNLRARVCLFLWILLVLCESCERSSNLLWMMMTRQHYMCDPLCEIQAKVSKSNYEIIRIKVWFQPFISLWFQSLTWS